MVVEAINECVYEGSVFILTELDPYSCQLVLCIYVCISCDYIAYSLCDSNVPMSQKLREANTLIQKSCPLPHYITLCIILSKYFIKD